MTIPSIDWQYLNFNDLNPLQLYRLLQLRVEIFVVEQEAIYQDLDDYDQAGIHVLGLQNEELVCYSRLLPPGLKYPEVSIGRVIVKNKVRKLGLGNILVQKSIDKCTEIFPDESVRISAQQYLEKYYHRFGFKTESEAYLEDGIPHIEMLLNRCN